MVDIAAWLNRLGLQQYEQAFRDNDIDAEVLPELTAEDLIGRQIGPVEPCQTQITAAQIGCSAIFSNAAISAPSRSRAAARRCPRGKCCVRAPSRAGSTRCTARP